MQDKFRRARYSVLNDAERRLRALNRDRFRFAKDCPVDRVESTCPYAADPGFCRCEDLICWNRAIKTLGEVILTLTVEPLP